MWTEKIFQGFVECYYDSSDNRIKPVTKIDEENLLTWDQAEQQQCFGGILLPNLVDISSDNAEESNRLLQMVKGNNWKCIVLQNPKSMHNHFVFRDSLHRIKNKGKDIPVVCGVIADIHDGKTIIPLKFPDCKRYPPIFETNDIDEVPDELLSLENADFRFFNMKDHEGRNDKLFGYISVLIRELKLNNDSIQMIFHNINEYMFADHLPKKELETICRDEAIDERRNLIQVDETKKLTNVEVGSEVIDYFNIVTTNGVMYQYKNGVYVPVQDEVIGQYIRQLHPYIRKSQKLEAILNMITAFCNRVDSRLQGNQGTGRQRL